MFGLPTRICELLRGNDWRAAFGNCADSRREHWNGGQLAQGVDWKPNDEVLIARGEFPAHFATWLPMQDAGETSRPNLFLRAEDFLRPMI